MPTLLVGWLRSPRKAFRRADRCAECGALTLTGAIGSEGRRGLLLPIWAGVGVDEDVNCSPPAVECVITEEEDTEDTDETAEKVACEEVPT